MPCDSTVVGNLGISSVQSSNYIYSFNELKYLGIWTRLNLFEHLWTIHWNKRYIRLHLAGQDTS